MHKVAAALLLIGLSVTIIAKEYSKSDHFDGKHFYNPYVSKERENGFFEYWKWRFFEKPNKDLWPKYIQNKKVPQPVEQVKENEVYITFINHATELIQLSHLNILTDPMFSDRASPFSWYGPKRIRSPALTIKELPKIDIVLISHNHYDHMDLPSIEALVKKDNPLFIVPLKNIAILQKVGVTRIIELDWWQNYPINNTQAITLLPAQHWSKRTLFDKNKSLWGSFLITSDKLKIIFMGDTGYGPHIKDIHHREGDIDVAVIPIGSYEPRWFMKLKHINPEEAVIVHLELHSQLSMAMQFDTFQLSNERYEAPTQDLKRALVKHNVRSETFIAPEVGETIKYQKIPSNN